MADEHENNIKIGDIVARRSYKTDVFFKVDEIITDENGETTARLRGLDVRLMADSPVNDLVKVDKEQIRDYRRKFVMINNEQLKRIFSRRMKKRETKNGPSKTFSGDFFELPGQVLHIDGNLEYLDLCMTMYKQLGIKAEGVHVPETDQPAAVQELMEKYAPDILVLTGHDGLIKSTDEYGDLQNYNNSPYFVEAVKAARKIENNKDNLIIFAGACQSHYEAILSAGANFASSPMRVLIHAFDPVFIVEKIAFTPIDQNIPIDEVIENTISGTKGVGGIETRGKFRKGFPKSPY